MQITTIGLHLAKHWFQIHGIDARGAVAVRRKLRRRELLSFFQSIEPCLVGMEACAAAHHWAREILQLIVEQPHDTMLRVREIEARQWLSGIRDSRADGVSAAGPHSIRG